MSAADFGRIHGRYHALPRVTTVAAHQGENRRGSQVVWKVLRTRPTF